MFDSPQHKAARASAEARKKRAQERKERDERRANAPVCGFCNVNKSYGAAVDDKPICGPCLSGLLGSKA